MSLIDKTWELVEQFTADPVHVTINESNIENLAGEVKKHIADAQEFFIGKPKWMADMHWGINERELYELFMYELILDSVNYNYWYGKGTIRPGGASSYKMSKLLDEAFIESHCLAPGDSRIICGMALRRFKWKLIKNRYPNLANRIKHLEEISIIFTQGNGYPMQWVDVEFLQKVAKDKEDAETMLEFLTETFATYASDMFLKRAFLFIIEMNRRIGWFKKDIHKIPISADYHIPKMLCYYGILTHSNELKRMIGSHSLIQSGSLMECEIRASAMKACKLVAEEAGVTMADVDTFLFANRKNSLAPFHLTITTDY